MIVEMTHPALQYMGRIDKTNPRTPRFVYAGSWMRVRFSGDAVWILLKNQPVYNKQMVGYILDGVEGVLSLADGTEVQRLAIPVQKTGTPHTLTVFKRLDGSQFYSLMGIELVDGGEILPLPPLPARKIELFGDSVSAGICCEAVEAVAQPDPPARRDGSCNNAWHAFGMTAARLLHAQIHNNAQGGLALLDGTGYFHFGALGLESTYDKLAYSPCCEGGVTRWNFTRYVPDVVIFAVGQNDHHIGDTDNNLLTGDARAAWIARFGAIITDLMEKYPQAEFVLTLTLVQHDPDFETLLDELCAAVDSPRVQRFSFARSGKATPGHPRIPEQAEMAVALTEYLQRRMGW